MCKSCADQGHTLLKSTPAVHNLCAAQAGIAQGHVVNHHLSAPAPHVYTTGFSTAVAGFLSPFNQPLSTSSTGPITRTII